MKLPDRIASRTGALCVAVALAGCAASAREPLGTALASPATNGPAADYPVVIGEPFQVGGVTYTPADTMNYDQVGYVLAEQLAVSGVTGAHRTLPLPSYVEIAALDSGRTILVRIERRGPMTNDRLVALSPMALAQLGIGDGAAIRMRRVNPPEDQRAKLRAGEEARPRMDTPEGLLTVLRKRLTNDGSASLSDPRQAQISGSVPSEAAIRAIEPDPPAPDPVSPAPNVPVVAPPTPAPRPATVVVAEGKFVIQLGAFSVRANAERLAEKVSGFLVDSGRLTIVRTGPYATRGQAADALAKLRAQGYSDAGIRSSD